jgi:hypothetical protein
MSLPINQNPLKLEQIRPYRWKVGPLKNNRAYSVNGFDTETLDGYAKLICDSSGENRDIDNIEQALDYLTSKRYRSAYNFFFNLRYDIQAIIKYLPKDNLMELYKSKKTKYQDTDIFYIQNKIFRLSKSKHSYQYFDVAQFFEGMSLESASAKYLGEHKISGLDRALIGSSPKYWTRHKKRIVKYCIQDAKLAQGLGELLNQTVKTAYKLRPRKWTSKARLSKDYFRTFSTVPDISKIPTYALSQALASYSGGRFEVSTKGRIKQAWLIDICSAYPYAEANLPDVTTGKWSKVREMDPEALLGFYLCRVYIPPMALSPIQYRCKNGLMLYPCGEWACYLSKSEIETYSRDIEIEIVSGCEYSDPNPTYPFRERVRQLYRLKAKTRKTHFQYDLIKKTLNSLYGSFYEKPKQGALYQAGQLFNPVYASLITASARCQLWDIIRKYPKNILGCATDGIMLDVEPDLEYSKDLGAWSRDGNGESVIIRSGVYKVGDKAKNRGLSKVERLTTPYGKYDDIWTYISDNPRLTIYPITVDRPLNLGECLTQTKKKNVNMINVWHTYDYKIDINTDHKRIWDDVFSGGGQLFERAIKSTPLMIGLDSPGKA